MTACHKCGDTNQAGRDFCPECGEFMGWEADGQTAVPAPDPAAPVRPVPAGSPPPARPPDLRLDDRDEAVRRAREEIRLAEADAHRVRMAAEERARASIDTAQRRATEEVRQARAVASAQANATIDAARRDAYRTNGISAEEVASVVAQVRQEAEAKARADADRAELAAARKARRAREEAHRLEQAETAEADRKARDVARRAAAMVAQPAPPTAVEGTPATTTGRLAVYDAAAGEPSATGPLPVASNAAGVGPVPPGPTRWQPPPAPPPPVPPPANIGDRVCGGCQLGNDPSRRFCRRCGQSLVPVPVPEPVSWWDRLWHRRAPGAGAAGDHEVTTSGQRRGGSTKPPPSLRTVARRAAAVVAVGVLVLGLGPRQAQTKRELTRIRERLLPKPTYINGAVAYDMKNKPIQHLTDTLVDQAIFLSPPSSSKDNLAFYINSFGGDPSATVNLFKIGLITGNPAPHHVQVVAYGPQSVERRRMTLDLGDTSKFQSFTFAVKDVTRLVFFVPDTYSVSGQGPYVIDKVELFALS